MQIVIPMSGAGSRFARQGYRDPKPLIPVDGVPMIERVVRMFPDETDFLFICSRTHLEETELADVLRRTAPAGRIVPIDSHKLGPVYAAMQAAPYIRDNEPIILNYCDFSVYWDYTHFRNKMATLNCDGAITAYRGFHPHSLGPNLYAYLRHDNNRLLEIREKHCFTENRMQEYASSGTYYFKSGALLKRYFLRTMERTLTTNGEFYASTPFNLLLEDGLDVNIYELQHFLQWGTPEDLQEYQAWSDYFAHCADSKPASISKPCNILIPMAGDGARFARENYSEPKPLISIAGTTMIERSLGTLPAAANCVAVCRSEQIRDGNLSEALRRSGRHVQTVPLEVRTEGQACTCLLAEPYLDPEEPVLVAPCDTSMVYDEASYLALTSDPEVDCVVWTFRNHPHANRNPKQYGWILSNRDGFAEKISCKLPLSGDVSTSQGIIGAFWFRRAQLLFDAIRELIRSEVRVNNEFYLDSAVQGLIERGCRVRALDVKHYICFGTPDDVRTFEYWESYFRKATHHPFGKEDYNDRADDASLYRAAVLQRSTKPANPVATIS